jgi:hypothetical protein
VFLPKRETQNLGKVWDFIAVNLLEYNTIFGNKSFTKPPDFHPKTRRQL